MSKRPLNWNQNQINADIAIRNRLFVAGFVLHGNLCDVRDGYTTSTVILHYVNDVPVAVAFYDEDTHYQIQVFVRKAFRRQGIGSMLVKQIMAQFPRSNNAFFMVGQGAAASIPFWRQFSNQAYVRRH